MSLQEEELVSSHAGQPEQASSLLDQIMAQTRIQPGSEGYDVARQGVTAFIASILQSTASAEPVNKLVVDSMIADIDERISRQMDVIIHAPAFQQVESFWRSLKTMVDRVDFRENIKVNVLHVTKQELLEDFEFAPEIIQSGFYKHVYSSGFGQFGGEPIAAVLGAYEFKNTAPDMKLLQYVSAVGAMAHAPFLSSVSPEFMGLNSWTELPNIKDLYAIFEGPAYTKWRALRDSEDSRYLGLTAPRFLLRQPYSPTDNPVKNFNYYEDVSQNHEDYLWGNTAWMLACNTVRGFIAGIACSVAVASALWWWQVYPVQQQLLQVNDTAQGAATVWMASPELENYERRLQQLLDTSPVQPLETGMQMMRVADSRWPESLQQQQASTQWNEALKTRAQSSPQLRGWLQTRQDLHAFADLVMQREKEGLTLSYIKNVIWQAERGLGQETPVESLLTQYHDARAQKQNTDALEKQINERLEGVLSRWLLLKNNVMPEAATGTTAEK